MQSLHVCNMKAVCRNQNAPHEQLVASSTHNKSPGVFLYLTMPFLC